jgi:hypothetical protein
MEGAQLPSVYEIQPAFSPLEQEQRLTSDILASHCHTNVTF